MNVSTAAKRMQKSLCKYLGAAALLAAAAAPASAVNFEVLHDFTTVEDGRFPSSNVGLDAEGNIYGGTLPLLWRYSKNGHYRVVHTFDYNTEGNYPVGKPISDAQGRIYGTLRQSKLGDGALYVYDPAVGMRFLQIPKTAAPNEQRGPFGGLIRDESGVFYGTTYGTEYLPHVGATIFSVDPAFTTVTTLHVFQPGEGQGPQDELSLFEGKLHGVTRYGGEFNRGTIFEFDIASRTMTKVTSIDRGYDAHGLTFDDKGYRWASMGYDYDKGRLGLQGDGFLFSINRSGNAVITQGFSGKDGSNPRSKMVMGDDGYLYGTTQAGGRYCGRCGSIYRVDPATSEHKIIHSFRRDGRDGGSIYGVTYFNNALYGTTYRGGKFGYGVLYRMVP